MAYLFIYYLMAINVLAFAITGIDKWLAKANKRRVSEKKLLGLVAFGGVLGGSLAMVAFRHKTAKKAYLLPFFTIIALQAIVLFGVYYWVKK